MLRHVVRGIAHGYDHVRLKHLDVDTKLAVVVGDSFSSRSDRIDLLEMALSLRDQDKPHREPLTFM